jgi:hypothetical protein
MKTTGLVSSLSDKLYPAISTFCCNAGRDEFRDEHLHHASLTQETNQRIKESRNQVVGGGRNKKRVTDLPVNEETLFNRRAPMHSMTLLVKTK